MQKRPARLPGSAISKVPLESSLYPLVRDFLKSQGFVVHAEAHNCDVAGHRGEELVIVELKRSLNLELLSQGVARLKLTDLVYVAIPHPETSALQARVRSFFPVLRKLELGLLWVHEAHGEVSVALQPMPFQRRRQPRSRRALLTELAGRSGDDNIGGTHRTKLVTAYRESAVHIAVALRRLGPSKPRDLRKLGTGTKTLGILSGNVYGWFARVDHGIYQITEKGIAGLTQWRHVAARKEALLPPSDANGASLPPPLSAKPSGR